MKFAVLSDIHGNSHALDAVLAEVRREEISTLLLLGDYLGYYYRPDIVLDMLQPFKKFMIRGNHEDMLELVLRDETALAKITEKYGQGLKHALQRLTRTQTETLVSLPEQLPLEFAGIRILLCHGSPWDADAYIYPDAPAALVKRYDDYEFDFIFSGHTHYACAFKTTHGLAINPGSVGQSRRKGGYAEWVLLDTANSSFQFRSTPYPVEDLRREVAELDLDTSYHYRILTRGHV